MRVKRAELHQGSPKPKICLRLFCQLSLIGNKKVDAMRSPSKLFRLLTLVATRVAREKRGD